MLQSAFVNINGQIVPSSNASLTIQNRAFRYGDGLFETIRLSDSKLMFFKYHMERLFAGMKIMKLQTHNAFNREFIASEIFALLKANKHFKNARIRLTVFRADGGYYQPVKNNLQYLIEAEELPHLEYQAGKGLIVDLYKEVRKDFSALSALKSINALPYVLAGVYCQEQKVDDCILLNSHDRIVEAVSSNVFLVKDDKVYTPELTEGCVDGVMRRVTIELLKRRGIQLLESKLDHRLLEQADEIFLSNAIKGIQPVVGFGLKRYFSKLSKLLLADLNQLHVQQRVVSS